MLRKNDEITLTIDGMTSEGSGIGRFEGQAVFVAGTAVGDVILCHIIKAKKTYAVGKVFKVFTPSPDRVPADCEVSAQCGGCCYRHISYDAELRYKQQRVADAFKRLGHLDVIADPVTGSPITDGYRNKAQYPVSLDKNYMPVTGFYAANTHRIVPCEHCMLQPPVFTEILGIVRRWIVKAGITVYDEKTGKGLLRHIYLRQGYYTKEIMVCLVINGEKILRTKSLIEKLEARIPDFRTLVINKNTAHSNVILGTECETLYGDGFITDILLGKKFRIGPLSFYQVNSAQTENLYRKAAEYALGADSGESKGGVLLDLYCGIGTIGLTMADKFKHIYGVEIVPEAIENAKINAAQNGIENASFICGDAADAAEKLRRDGVTPDIVLVDPPRKGLAPELIETINEFNPHRVVYVSCDPATLARDCARFSLLGYTAERVTPFDMFPRTSHVECVCLLTRS